MRKLMRPVVLVGLACGAGGALVNCTKSEEPQPAQPTTAAAGQPKGEQKGVQPQEKYGFAPVGE
ncbi:MAG: hypothetical protein AB1716_04280 [Planctomycetota bacterium]